MRLDRSTAIVRASPGRSPLTSLSLLLLTCAPVPAPQPEPTPQPADPAPQMPPERRLWLTHRVCERGAAAMQRCDAFWAPLRAGTPGELPLAARCELATVLASGVVHALDMLGSPWQRVGADTLAFTALLANDRKLIADTESCPPARGVRFYGPNGQGIDVDIIGRARDPDLALRLTNEPISECACIAAFAWRLGADPRRPDAPPPDDTRLAPTLVLGVVMNHNGALESSSLSFEFD